MGLKVGIICACEIELVPFIPHIQNSVVSEKAMLKVHEGTVGGINVAALFCGVCKVNAALATQILIDVYKVDVIINSGSAGGMDTALNIFDTVISTDAAYHDVHEDILTKYHPYIKSVYFEADKKLLELAKKAVSKLDNSFKIYFGRMATGESFIEDSFRDEINEKHSPLSVDMETASIAHVCHVNKIPFIAVRSITDTATHSGAKHFEANFEKASVIAKDVTLAVLREINDINQKVCIAIQENNDIAIL